VKIKTPKDTNFRRIANILRKRIECSGNGFLFFLQREKDDLTPDLLHTEFGKGYTIYSMKHGGKSQTIEAIVFLNETLFKNALFHNETGH
jgi:hypothetical protein